jgi:phosphopantothenate-cysteine ligase/phosphopantothenoylcysteine decarboxylase/phosphopantothenate--cysteine ligase
VNVLVTAGNTQTPIDKVRCITNIFSGRTGTRIAIEAVRREHHVTLFTSHPEIVAELAGKTDLPETRWRVQVYRTFDELHTLMEAGTSSGRFEAIIHAAAVSDYALAGVYAKREDGKLTDVAAAKVKSGDAELWLKLMPTPKLVDRIRPDWGFKGILVKFKLEVGLGERELRDVAEKARTQSQADFLVANTLEGMSEWALIGPIDGNYVKIERGQLAKRLVDLLELPA